MEAVAFHLSINIINDMGEMEGELFNEDYTGQQLVVGDDRSGEYVEDELLNECDAISNDNEMHLPQSGIQSF
ncbi:hypothetical protein vseg_013639 [Gypsophila vaccaria]